ncbi:MAG: helix-turn-helix transcriptional regulator [Clostridia bacterium]|nr:helix-turn-helix transcriptional regulator [Clostridia bacterium]
MNILDENIVITEIKLAILMTNKTGLFVQRCRPNHGIAFNLDCSSTYKFDTEKVITAHPGECVYLPKGSKYEVDRSTNETGDRNIYCINFLTASEESFEPFSIKIRPREEMISLFSKAEKAWSRKNTGYYEECASDLYRIIKLIKQERSEYFSESRTLRLLFPALEYINENYKEENITASQLADLCKISEPYLRKLFKQAFSVSPMVYVRNMRISYACELLRSGEYSVTDAATLSGFNDTAYFSREFKQYMGVTPREYRDK